MHAGVRGMTLHAFAIAKEGMQFCIFSQYIKQGLMTACAKHILFLLKEMCMLTRMMIMTVIAFSVFCWCVRIFIVRKITVYFLMA